MWGTSPYPAARIDVAAGDPPLRREVVGVWVNARAGLTQSIPADVLAVSTAPEELRGELRDLSAYQVLTTASAYRHTGRTDVTTVTKLTLWTLARRALSLEDEVKEIDRLLKILVKETAPELNAIDGVGSDVASATLVAAGDNPERLKTEATFAKLCGVSPSTLQAASKSVTASIAVGTASPTRHYGTSSSPGWCVTRRPGTTSRAG